jgi:DNA-binding LacI/PurR family transcriptional regulator
VEVENFESSRRMAEHLLALGHRRIALIGAEPQLHYVPPRIAGARRALADRGLDGDESLVATGISEWDPDATLRHVDGLLRRPAPDRPTALCCTGDGQAALALVGAGRAGLRVPEDVSVSGFNDDSSAVRQHPPLTTMRQPYAGMGDAAIALLLEQIAGTAGQAKKLTLPAELVVRASTAPPPA